jgi:ribosomal protein L11 methyltransferase
VSATGVEAAARAHPHTPRPCKLSAETTDPAFAHALADALESLHSPAPDAVTRFEAGPGIWRVEAYFPPSPALDPLRARLGSILGGALPALLLESIPDLNWVAISQATLPPVQAGRFTVHGTHDRARVPRSPNTILIDAGEAFGTAHHATTLGCLQAIDRLTRRLTFARVLNLGCGSGILAIAAARATPRAQMLATDNDPVAIAVAAENAKANGVESRVAFACASGLAHPWLRHAGPFDLIIANILAGPLKALALDVGKAVLNGGIIVLSGLIEPEAPAVIAAYAVHKVALVEHRRIAGWATLTLRKRG